MDALDREKPEITSLQDLCSGCWAVTQKNDPTWIPMKFAHLDPVLLCPKCQYTYADDFEKMQRAGL